MGDKGAKMTPDSVISAELIVEKLIPIGGITSKKMFGGHGIFHDGKMFGIIDSKGNAFMKADETTQAQFEEKESVRHSKMPYFSIPKDVFSDADEMVSWAKTSISISK